MNINEILTKYDEELKKDTIIDNVQLRECQMKLPGIRHKWVARLINHKQKIIQLKELKEEAKKTLIEKLNSSANVSMPPLVLDKKIETCDEIVNINKNIRSQELIVEYLEKVEGIMKSMTYDITNLVNIMKLEEL